MNAITIDEGADASSELVKTRLVRREQGDLALARGDSILPLPDGALEAVMKRYGKPLETDLVDPLGAALETLELGDGRRLIRFRFRPRFDVIARDYLALVAPAEQPLCELSTAISAALEHLGESFRLRREASVES